MEVLNNIYRKAHSQGPSQYWVPPGKPNRHERRRIQRQVRRGRRVAAARAFGGAQLYLAGLASTLADAAMSSGSTVAYVRAAIVILQSKDERLQQRVLKDHVPLLVAARQVKPVNSLLKIYGEMGAEAKRAFFRAAGADQILDDLVAAG